MTKNEALQKLKVSLSKGAQIIPPKNVEYEHYLSEITDKLFNCVIEPKVASVTSACYPVYAFKKYKNSKVWAIAHSGNDWLLTIENEEEFALGFGKNVKDIEMLGFSSSDAVHQWWS